MPPAKHKTVSKQAPALSKEEIANSLRLFRSRRDSVLHEDADILQQHIGRFVSFAKRDALIQRALAPFEGSCSIDPQEWIHGLRPHDATLGLGDDPGQEMCLRWLLIQHAASEPDFAFYAGSSLGYGSKRDCINRFRTLLVHPFMEELGHLVGETANLATPEAREVQAVPLSRIPGPKEARIFLSHKTADKPLVLRYYDALREIGFAPWLDNKDMPAGVILERSIYQGFEESCAAVFFVTENFEDEQFLATEVEYAMEQKRAKGNKFAIIVLRYSQAASIPKLFRRLTWAEISNDLEGFAEILQALPIEPGAVRWKAAIVE